MRDCHVGIVAGRRNGTLYVGVTGDLVRRVYEHREGLAPGFTERYGVGSLVWFEAAPNVKAAIRREEQIEKWQRAWKVRLIEATNPTWRDLYHDLLG
jgi:putative endonuclease